MEETTTKTMELYAIAVGRYYEGIGRLQMVCGFTFASSPEEAEENLLAEHRDELYQQYGEPTLIQPHILVLAPDMIERFKEVYNLRDNLDLWRDQLDSSEKS